ncbi:hypothetical protein PPERSA_13146 [Pseudocohnilembus persalinus]|uniref:Band 7 domain-containing protein n=1 Tax=Pseudocohnilembus persalinus TaxID=266149 RepID=A0A0V0QBG1_PSEPJ|nr:hypothetical protein PPERSA_13146 [Pseudocohnilembus persalinus]|eukprot:KRW99566.1 hypothetical protein PPERSA_13146 [Pseudocohnilembus persalinus]
MSDTRQIIIFLVLGLSILEASFAPNYYLLAISLSLTLIPVILIHFISQGWITSKGNEWLLIIQNGELKRAGVGLKTFKFWNQVAVKFPSTINGVTFEAAQVTSENFGIQIKGVVYWAVYRQGDGPFKCYKYIQGTNANENVKQMTESIVRSQISNTKLLEVLKNRHALREAVTTNLRQSLEGWGIWAETVEITEVIISSSQTFKDMQTEFRFTHKQLALKANQETGQKLEAQRQKFNLQKTTIQSDLQTKYIEKEQEENLKREEQVNNFKKKEIEFKKEQLLQKKELEIYLETKLQTEKSKIP